ncbi:hypothetical protein C479_14253 [Halovivax asiaticus JCM 14624]|uniref:Uncharacterized protein n=1 Tax=Halovivax asiaticus JCM 14624 TaxID=1227490 RepID=M0BDZ9_9EURY|nr:hypothetical protein [Halovivax asiaticus]ELZ08508.1 hypothetical protein C479_14253 [Halovivax asiaticus JCM 14624]
MRIQKTDRRARNWENLKKATGESTVSGALDAATVYFLRMAGSEGHPTGSIEKLMLEAEERGSLTGEEIAEILDQPQLAIEFETDWSVSVE